MLSYNELQCGLLGALSKCIRRISVLRGHLAQNAFWVFGLLVENHEENPYVA
jgi:hypothetical protein